MDGACGTCGGEKYMQELGEETEERHLGRPALAREGKETGSVGVDWVSLTHDGDFWQARENTVP
jgi:hypothetical protein